MAGAAAAAAESGRTQDAGPSCLSSCYLLVFTETHQAFTSPPRDKWKVFADGTLELGGPGQRSRGRVSHGITCILQGERVERAEGGGSANKCNNQTIERAKW